MGLHTNRLSLFLALFMLCNTGIAGDGVGGGGVVICRDKAGNVTSAELLDFYEARMLPPRRNIALGDATLTAVDKVKLALNRLKHLDPERAKRYEQKAEEFFRHVGWEKNIPLTSTNDFGYVQLEPNCKIEQLCRQDWSAKNKYTIDQNRWNQLVTDHHAGLLLHEIAYEEAMALGHKTSVATRKLTGLLGSRELENLNPAAYRSFLKNLSFEAGGGPFWAMNPIILPGAIVGSAYAAMVATFASQPEGKPMTFVKVTGPAWCSLDSDGTLRGTPSLSDEGQSTVVVSATDSDGLSAQVVVQVTVNKLPAPLPQPLDWAQSTINLGIQRVGSAWISAQLRNYLKHPSGKETFGREKGCRCG